MAVPRKALEPQLGTTLRQQVCAAIKEDILEGVYAPGTVLSENQLAEKFRISRTPVREALRELATGGLVRILPQRGVIVSELTIQDVAELYQLREALECFAARFAAENIREKDIAGFRADHAKAVQHLQAERLHDVYNWSIKMHSRIYDLTGNARLKQMMDQFSDQVRRIGMLTLRHGRSPFSIAEHGEIIDAIAAAAADLAERLMRQHMRSDRDVVLNQILGSGRAAA